MTDSESQTIEVRIEALKRRHQRLEERIDAFNEQGLLTPRERTERKRMQKLKLATRDEIAELENQMESAE
jgi:hypothetical protein